MKKRRRQIMRPSLRAAIVFLLVALFLRLSFSQHKQPPEASTNLRSSSQITTSTGDITVQQSSNNNERNMGAKSSKSSSTKDQTKEYITASAPSSEAYALKKRRPGCTGMFWRKDPEGKIKLQSNDNWPRDGSILKGEMRTVKGAKWLAATHVKQAGGAWVATPYGAHIPFEYDNHYYLEKMIEQ